MDTLFRLVSFQQPHPQQHQQQQSDHSFNNSTNSSSSIRSSSNKNSNNNNNSHYYYCYQPYNNNNTTQDQEECFNFFMDEDDFSSSSSHNKQYQQQQQQQYTSNPYNQFHQQYPSTSQSLLDHPSSTTTSTPTPTNTPPTTHYGSGIDDSGCGFNFTDPTTFTGKWATNALTEAARAISDNNTTKLHQLLWVLNELSSPYGDVEQKLSSYFTTALFNKMTDSGDTCYRSMRLAVDKTFSFESTRKMLLKFQEVSPWTTFGHVASNGALIDALEGEPKLHIIDISNTFCTQWPTLLEALATRMDDTPHLKITTILINKFGCVNGGAGGGDDGGGCGGGVQRVMREIGSRLEKFARLMGVPFKFNVIHHNGDLSDIDFTKLEIVNDEALAINCVNSLHAVNVHQRDVVLAAFRRLNPRVVTVVEEEADIVELGGGYYDEFMKGFYECLRWFRVYFESLDESFSRTSNEKLMLERAAGRALVDLLACPEAVSRERREVASRWSGRMGKAGFGHVAFSEEVCDDVRALLRRYKEGWSMVQCGGGGGDVGGAGIFLSWKDQPVVWASAWKP